MPTQHKKEKSKAAANSNIKIEPQDSHPLSYYVDDRVELIRQIFMSLKSKTIKSIAPDFLQGETLEGIQECCLDELLGISKKRLLSIINSTQCPANTDSSDSDVENVEDHISLEEISSDSADDTLNASKTKVTTKGKKKVSVLELLELQARARAIRSQLALEPITKIELDSDNDSDSSSSSKNIGNSTTAAIGSTDKNQSQKKAKSSSNDKIIENNGIQVIKPSVPKVKPVRLKRNFRQRQNDDYNPDDEDETRPQDNSEQKETDSKSVDDKKSEDDRKPADDKKSLDGKVVQSSEGLSENQRNENERSPSPDIIPIIQEPETYFISSDSDEGNSKIPKYITMPTVTKEKLPETEDEKFLKKIKEGSGADLRKLIRVKSKTTDTDNSGQSSSIDKSAINESHSSGKDENSSSSEKYSEKKIVNDKTTSNDADHETKDTEPEEGELTDDEDELAENNVTVLSSDDDDKDDEVEADKKCETGAKDVSLEAKQIDVQSDSESSGSGDDTDTDSSSDTVDKPTFKEGDDDDDIIDLGKDEDLDFDREVEQIDAKKGKKSKKLKKKLKNNENAEDVPSSNEEKDTAKDVPNEENLAEGNEVEASANQKACESDRENEEGNQQEVDTWQSRWLRGRNVTKVMATSRLANKVRIKIKQKKYQSEQETATLDDSTTVTEATATSTSTAEVGSVQHYEELVAQDTEK